MNDVTSRRLTGVLLILTPIAFNLLFTLLSVTFEYPDILREPAGYVLERFDAGGAGLVARFHAYRRTLSAAGGSGASSLGERWSRSGRALLPRPRHGLWRCRGYRSVPGAGPLAIPGLVPC